MCIDDLNALADFMNEIVLIQNELFLLENIVFPACLAAAVKEHFSDFWTIRLDWLKKTM